MALTLTLTLDTRPGRYVLVCGTISYPIELRPETAITAVRDDNK